MSRRLRERLNVQKTTRFAVVINVLQIMAMGGVFCYVLFNHDTFLSRKTEITLLGICLVIVIWGAIMDIRDAAMARKISEQTQMIEEAYLQLEDLNGLLRSQRHDFMNHLQVVYSLTELEEHEETMKYIERIYDDIQRVSGVLKTSIPAVNALIAAKHTDCEERGIRFETEISSPWSGLHASGWEMCRIFGNLIDNARDAITESGITADRFIRISLSEKPGAYIFSVSNNGPRIPEKILASIFQPGFTTKSEGHGSGLAIVSEILQEYNGNITVSSDDSETVFSGVIPKQPSAPVRTN